MQTLTQQNSHSLVSLANKLAIAQFRDPKTRELYSALAEIDTEGFYEVEMKQGEKLTSLNSHFSISKYKSFREQQEQSYAIKGATLTESPKVDNFNRNRTYSIVKVSKERKRAITASDLEKAPKDKGKPKEIVYTYAEAKEQPISGLGEVVQSRYINKEKDNSLKSSRNDLRSMLSTRYNPNTSQYNPSAQFPLSRNKAKSYKFMKLQEKSTAQKQEKVTCNLFNFLDQVVNRQDHPLKKLPSAKMEIIAKPIKLKRWVQTIADGSS